MNAMHSQVIAVKAQMELHVFIDSVQSNQKSSNLSLTQVQITWVHTSGGYGAFLALITFYPHSFDIFLPCTTTSGDTNGVGLFTLYKIHFLRLFKFKFLLHLFSHSGWYSANKLGLWFYIDIDIERKLEILLEFPSLKKQSMDLSSNSVVKAFWVDTVHLFNRKKS